MTWTQLALRIIGGVMWGAVLLFGTLSVGEYRPYELNDLTGEFEYEAAEKCGNPFSPDESVAAECAGKLDTVRSNLTLLAIGGTGFLVVGWIPARRDE